LGGFDSIAASEFVLAAHGGDPAPRVPLCYSGAGFKAGQLTCRAAPTPQREVSMITLHVFLMILAVLCLFLAALNIQPPRGNFLAAGLFLWAMATIVSV
jgi:hypothetical protein